MITSIERKKERKKEIDFYENIMTLPSVMNSKSDSLNDGVDDPHLQEKGNERI